VTLQSCFEIRNETNILLCIRLCDQRQPFISTLSSDPTRVATTTSSQDTTHQVRASPVWFVRPQDTFHVPLLPLYEYAAMSKGRHIGYVFLTPVESADAAATTAVEGEGISLLDLMVRRTNSIDSSDTRR
jgi:hypothetical protein